MSTRSRAAAMAARADGPGEERRASRDERASLMARLRNFGHLVTGGIANAAIMLVGAVVAARALGPEVFGVLTLVIALARTAERVLRFESWQPLIRYAAQIESGDADAHGDPSGDLGRLFAFGIWLDVGAAGLAALIAVAAATAFGELAGLPEDGALLVAIYALALMVNWSGMPAAVLRLSGRFRLMAYYQLAASLLRVALALGLWAMDAGLVAFVAAWTLTQGLNSLLLTWLALRCLGERGIAMPWRVSPGSIPGRFPGFIRFAFSTSLSSSLRTLTVEADVLLVGALAGSSAAGFYYIAKRLAKVAQQVGVHVQSVLYPDIARMWSSERFEAFRRTTSQMQAVLALVGGLLLAGVWLVGEPALRIAFGADYAAAYPLFLTQVVAAIFVLHAAPARSALLAMNRPHAVLMTMLAGTIVFFALAALLVPRMGALGASLAHVVLAAFVAIVLETIIRRANPARRAQGASAG